MTISSRDRRALAALAAALVIALAISFWPEDQAAPGVVTVSGSAGVSVERLQRVKQLAAQVPGKQEQLKALTAELGKWTSGVIESETGQQAQAELLQILRRISSQQTPPLEFASEEFGQIRPLGPSKDYGEALVAVSFDCAIEELVNLVADLSAQPEVVVTDEIRINPLNSDQKLLRVRLTVAGLIPHRLVPAQRGFSTF